MFVEPELPDAEDFSDVPSVHRGVTSDVLEIVVYRQGYLDGADGLAPARAAYAYCRGWNAGQQFRELVSGARPEPAEPRFPGWPSLGKVYTRVVSGIVIEIRLPKRLAFILARFSASAARPGRPDHPQ